MPLLNLRCDLCGVLHQDYGGIGQIKGRWECYAEATCDKRAALTRALTAQAWMVAIAGKPWLFDSLTEHAEDYELGEERGRDDLNIRIADLPTPADIAAEIMGDT